MIDASNRVIIGKVSKSRLSYFITGAKTTLQERTDAGMRQGDLVFYRIKNEEHPITSVDLTTPKSLEIRSGTFAVLSEGESEEIMVTGEKETFRYTPRISRRLNSLVGTMYLVIPMEADMLYALQEIEGKKHLQWATYESSDLGKKVLESADYALSHVSNKNAKELVGLVSDDDLLFMGTGLVILPGEYNFNY